MQSWGAPTPKLEYVERSNTKLVGVVSAVMVLNACAFARQRPDELDSPVGALADLATGAHRILQPYVYTCLCPWCLERGCCCYCHLRRTLVLRRHRM